MMILAYWTLEEIALPLENIAKITLEESVF